MYLRCVFIEVWKLLYIVAIYKICINIYIYKHLKKLMVVIPCVW